MPEAADVADIATRLQPALHDHETELACIYLFGSVATGQARPDSDLDLAVLFRHPQPRTLKGLAVTLRGAVEECTGRTVDLIDLDTAPVDLVHRVLRDGVLVLDADPARRIAFEVDARSRYFDLLPHLQEYRRGAAA